MDKSGETKMKYKELKSKLSRIQSRAERLKESAQDLLSELEREQNQEKAK